MNTRILLFIGSKNEDGTPMIKYSDNRIIEEAKKLGLTLDLATRDDIYLKTDKGRIDLYFGDKKIEEYTHLLIRSTFTIFRLGLAVSLIARDKGVRVMNADSYDMILDNYSKISQMVILSLKGIAVPMSESIGAERKLIEAASEDKIIKPTIGSLGKNVKVATAENIKSLLSEYTTQDLIMQEKLPNRVDYRVLVLGDKALGVMQKKATGDSLVTNFKAGGEVSSVDDVKVAALGEKAAKALNSDFVGVDVMYNSDGEPMVLEVNRNPQFEGFEKGSDVNVAEQLLKYMTGTSI